jgi:hypothetical protein
MWHVWGRRQRCTGVLWGPLDRKRPLGRLGYRSEDSIKICIKETELKNVDWINVAQDRDKWQAVVNVVMNLMSQKCGQFVD